MRSDRMTRRGGYTLIEVLIVITVLGIAGLAMVPALGSTGVLRVQGAVRTLVADITFAQADALAYQTGRAVSFNTDENTYTLVEVIGSTVDPETNALYDSSGPDQQYVVSFNDPRWGNTTIANPSFNGGSDLIFDELGAPVAAAGTNGLSTGGSVDIVSPDATFRVNVGAFTGRVTVQRLAP